MFDAVATLSAQSGGTVVEPRMATQDELALVHDVPYLQHIAALSGQPAMLDADTYMSPESDRIARLAAGAAVQAVERAFNERRAVMALVRPPGHHAERGRAMGFCLYNNVAVAAAAMRVRGVGRIAVVDVDVHHGNGTQAMFYDHPEVLYVSTHQYPFYPGTGAAEETGTAEGAGFTVNIPMEAGATDDDYDLVYREIVLPILEQFRPELLLISGGFDAHERDPLASMRMTTSGYARALRRLKEVAAPHGAVALVTEGGYELTALAECLQASIVALGSDREIASSDHPGATGGRGERAVRTARAAQRPYWRGI